MTEAPGTARIVRCFATPGQAVAAEFPVGAPAGSLAIHGVYLVSTGKITLRQCRRAARQLEFAVPCPRVSPTAADSPFIPPNCRDGNQDGPCSNPGRYSYFEFSEMGFAAPAGYVGAGPGDGHFVMLAVPVSEARNGASRDLFCVGQPARAHPSIQGVHGTLVACPEGDAETSGHVLLRWVHDGVLVGVSFHNLSATNIALDEAVAHHLMWIKPNRTRRR